MTITRDFESFQFFTLEISFVENENLFQKTGVLLLVEDTMIETQYSYTSLLFQKPTLRQIEWGVQNANHKERSFVPN